MKPGRASIQRSADTLGQLSIFYGITELHNLEPELISNSYIEGGLLLALWYPCLTIVCLSKTIQNRGTTGNKYRMRERNLQIAVRRAWIVADGGLVDGRCTANDWSVQQQRQVEQWRWTGRQSKSSATAAGVCCEVMACVVDRGTTLFLPCGYRIIGTIADSCDRRVADLKRIWFSKQCTEVRLGPADATWIGC